jgi:hypothetical protein
MGALLLDFAALLSLVKRGEYYFIIQYENKNKNHLRERQRDLAFISPSFF